MSTLTTDLPPGWLTDTEAAYLQEQATNKVVLEIGAWLGRSTTAMARTARLVVSVDHHHGPPMDTEGPTVARYLDNLKLYGVSENVIPVVAGFERMAPHLRCEFELAFVDGAHDGISVLRDARAAYLLVRVGGMLLFHDYDVHVGVTSAVHELSRRWQRAYQVVPDTSIAVIYKA